jgi:hypothetical protein
VSGRKHHEIWIEQCEAAPTIKARYGLKATFDYLKMMNFASVASKHSEFARGFPRFISEARQMFTPEEMRTHITRLEREQSENAGEALEEHVLLVKARLQPQSAFDSSRQSKNS